MIIIILNILYIHKIILINCNHFNKLDFIKIILLLSKQYNTICIIKNGYYLTKTVEEKYFGFVLQN
jgi:hypothetical protein